MKIKGLINSGEIKNIESLKNKFDSLQIEFDRININTDNEDLTCENKQFTEWREKTESK